MLNPETSNELERLRATKALRFAVSAKGGVSVYNLGRFPVTLYRGQWERLLAAVPELAAFIREHEAQLPVKASAVSEPEG